MCFILDVREGWEYVSWAGISLEMLRATGFETCNCWDIQLIDLQISSRCLGKRGIKYVVVLDKQVEWKTWTGRKRVKIEMCVLR